MNLARASNHSSKARKPSPRNITPKLSADNVKTIHKPHKRQLKANKNLCKRERDIPPLEPIPKTTNLENLNLSVMLSLRRAVSNYVSKFQKSNGPFAKNWSEVKYQINHFSYQKMVKKFLPNSGIVTNFDSIVLVSFTSLRQSITDYLVVIY